MIVSISLPNETKYSYHNREGWIARRHGLSSRVKVGMGGIGSRLPIVWWVLLYSGADHSI